ncbi:Tom37 metaxin N-terminal-like domain-containing protein [Luteithermobacter gelatinilyticus]|uniref:Tom37 metaxin N-terminal-like domain-containing protein n=1 Tax=Luteithermobacter gelatinilyticus TaxID=2582913 RepID=UPI001105F5FE|nr:Tom37 metaxin N-terminal-like domain-containing protein [Luteithermobacter gelatinilyticus]
MITLYKFGRLGNLVDPSPPCLKVDSYLRMAGLEYQAVDGVDGLRKAPKGKLPYIEDNGAVIPDSTFILHYLKDKYGDSVDGHLDDEEKAITHAFMKMMDENLYWGVLHSRWMLEENWPKLKRIFFWWDSGAAS